MERHLPTLKLAIWKEAALIFQSHQYVEIEIYKIHDYSLRREAVSTTTSEDFLVGSPPGITSILLPRQPPSA